MAALLILGGGQGICQLLQGVKAAVPAVLIQVIVGVHQVDKAAQPLPHTAQHLPPFVVPAGKNFAQQRAEGAAQGVQIVAVGTLQTVQRVQPADHGAVLAGVPPLDLRQKRLQLFCPAAAALTLVVLPVVQIIVVSQKHRHVCCIVYKGIVGARAGLDGVRRAASRAEFRLRLVQGTQQQGGKGHVIA